MGIALDTAELEIALVKELAITLVTELAIALATKLGIALVTKLAIALVTELKIALGIALDRELAEERSSTGELQRKSSVGTERIATAALIKLRSWEDGKPLKISILLQRVNIKEETVLNLTNTNN